MIFNNGQGRFDGRYSSVDVIVPPGGPGRGTPIFRAYRYGSDYPGLAGKDLAPGKPIVQ